MSLSAPAAMGASAPCSSAWRLPSPPAPSPPASPKQRLAVSAPGAWGPVSVSPHRGMGPYAVVDTLFTFSPHPAAPGGIILVEERRHASKKGSVLLPGFFQPGSNGATGDSGRLHALAERRVSRNQHRLHHHAAFPGEGDRRTLRRHLPSRIAGHRAPDPRDRANRPRGEAAL